MTPVTSMNAATAADAGAIAIVTWYNAKPAPVHVPAHATVLIVATNM